MLSEQLMLSLSMTGACCQRREANCRETLVPSGIDTQQLGVAFGIVSLNGLGTNTNEGKSLEFFSFELTHDLVLSCLVGQIVVSELECYVALCEEFFCLLARWASGECVHRDLRRAVSM